MTPSGADRAAGRLLVLGAYGEPGVDEVDVTVELAAELRSMAAWLGLDAGVDVARRGDLARLLRTAIS